MTELDVLTERYSEPHRHYHTLEHIGKMFQTARSMGLKLTPEQQKSIWWHDAVYNPKSKTNEEDSVVLMMKTYAWWEQKPTHYRIAEMIMATKTHQPENYDSGIVCDLDLSGLAAEWPIFERNSELIYREYSPFYSYEEYKQGRITFLEGMLDRKIIFSTHPFREFENRARINIEHELERWSI